VERDVDEQHGIREEHGERQKRDSELRIPQPPRVPEALGHATVCLGLVRFDGHLENGPGERQQDASTEEGDEQAQHHVGAREVEAGRPDEIHDDAEVGELDREPHVRPAGQQLKPAGASFGQIEQCGVD
jgi:hypothetical protein